MSTLKIINGEKIFCGPNTRHSRWVASVDRDRMERLRQMLGELTVQGANAVINRSVHGSYYAIFRNGVTGKPVNVGRFVRKNVKVEIV
jgi:hypothetical protein